MTPSTRATLHQLARDVREALDAYNEVRMQAAAGVDAQLIVAMLRDARMLLYAARQAGLCAYLDSDGHTVHGYEVDDVHHEVTALADDLTDPLDDVCELRTAWVEWCKDTQRAHERASLAARDAADRMPTPKITALGGGRWAQKHATAWSDSTNPRDSRWLK